jgi:hypothetical protein
MAAALLAWAAPLVAQTGMVPLGQTRTVDGHVQRPGAHDAPVPLVGVYVVLHRVGQDHAGPLDSVRTGPAGQYHFTYKTSGEPDAVYFASTRYAGIAYFTAPLERQHVAGADGDIMVFDTTSTGVTLHLAGRHLVVGAPGADGMRDIAEVFDLSNDSTRTLIARDSLTPVWSAPLPAGALAPQVNGGDIAAGAVTFTDGQIRLYAPISPGVRQLAVAFQLPPSAFPLVVPMAPGTAMLEVLLEEAGARPVLAGLKQTAPVSAQGRTFTRYLAQDVPAGAVLRVEVRAVSNSARTRLLSGIALAMVVIMGAALVLALRRRTRGAEPVAAVTPAPVAPVAPVLVGATPVEQLRFEMARLDAAHARDPGDDAEQERYTARRADLEGRIARALAEQERAP